MTDDITRRLASLGYEVTPDDMWVIGFLIDKTVMYIKCDCNIFDVPEELHDVAVDMVCGEFLSTKKASGKLDGFDVKAAVKQISEGDTSVTYAIPDDSLTLGALTSKLINGGKPQFTAYRRFKW